MKIITMLENSLPMFGFGERFSKALIGDLTLGKTKISTIPSLSCVSSLDITDYEDVFFKKKVVFPENCAHYLNIPIKEFVDEYLGKNEKEYKTKDELFIDAVISFIGSFRENEHISIDIEEI